jgi:hypothetical protein
LAVWALALSWRMMGFVANKCCRFLLTLLFSDFSFPMFAFSPFSCSLCNKWILFSFAHWLFIGWSLIKNGARCYTTFVLWSDAWYDEIIGVVYSVFGGWLETCAFCEEWYGSNCWTRCTFRISVGILQIFVMLCEIKSSHPMIALLTSVFAGVCTVNGQLEFTIAECINTACCSEKMLQSSKDLHV